MLLMDVIDTMQTDEDIEELIAEHRRCDFISYFGQSYERFDSGVTSESILRTYDNNRWTG